MVAFAQRSIFQLRAAATMGDSDIRQITETHFLRIHRAALVLTGNPWDADDLTQETFLVLSRELPRFRHDSTIYTWLYGILLNLDRNRRRRTTLRRNKLRVLWNQESNAEKSAPAAEVPLEMNEWNRSLWSRVAELPTTQRHALALRFSAQLRYEEIAAVLGCPIGTVKSRIFHGVAALREKMLAEHRVTNGPLQPGSGEVPHVI